MRHLKLLSVFLISFILVVPSKVLASELTSYEGVYTYTSGTGIQFRATNTYKGKYRLDFNDVHDISSIVPLIDSTGYEVYFYSSNNILLKSVSSFQANTSYSVPGNVSYLVLNITDSASDKLTFNFKDSTGLNLNITYKVLSEQTQYINGGVFDDEIDDEIEEETPEDKPSGGGSINVTPPNIDVSDDSSSGIMDAIISAIVDFFKELLKYGIMIMATALSLGTIFIGGRWLWRKTRQWLNNI